ncbi:threonine-phosphate decarboxylase CobD [Pandoraea apista]|uniref:threonine-phosphate decarboxylase n=1 Tax=Pandoraea apista TaxID=93218 RepID=A0A5E5PB61_9BURK|nr:threonine-phosphate decarboxylase CobD [Pandoraea apista]OXS93092.1 threonine-phosphate decarboxylase [Pandoraea apista]VVG73871.1 threonine-phosphate decarboxylase [Pandoraea apista]
MSSSVISPSPASATPNPSSVSSVPAGPATPRHGGNLGEAILRYRRPREDWIDLSTGVNPHGYPVPMPPASAWRDLPDAFDDLCDVAAQHYGVPVSTVVPCAGSQAVIRSLPTLLRPGRVAVASLTYSEYAPAFANAGHTLVPWQGPEAGLPDVDYLVWVNPDNPTTRHVSRETLTQWQARLAEHGGMLIVDEAFADVSPQASMTPHVGETGLVVLRSVGKFFGLAGIRAGFALCPQGLATRLAERLGAWTVSGPARFAVRTALRDTAWQAATRERLLHDGERLLRLLRAHDWPANGTPLFAWTPHPLAPQWHERLAAQGIWTRRFDDRPVTLGNGTTQTLPSLRLGLPPTEFAWQRLQSALAGLRAG